MVRRGQRALAGPGLLAAPAAWLASSPTRWYVVFGPAARRHWWDRVFRLPEAFSHVYALRWDGWNWILFNPHTAYTDVAILPMASEDALRGLLEPGVTVVEVEAFRQPEQVRGRWWAGPMTCVEQVKALLGLPVAWIWTPWQLYRYLMEHADGIEAQSAQADRLRAGPGAAPAIRARQIDP